MTVSAMLMDPASEDGDTGLVARRSMTELTAVS